MSLILNNSVIINSDNELSDNKQVCVKPIPNILFWEDTCRQRLVDYS